jgi:hypothetical protein
MKDHIWLKDLLWALSSSQETSLSWLLNSLSKLHNEEFNIAAEEAGLLLNGKGHGCSCCACSAALFACLLPGCLAEIKS